MVRPISRSRPITGSSSPPAASRVRSRQNWSSSLVSPPYSRSLGRPFAPEGGRGGGVASHGGGDVGSQPPGLRPYVGQYPHRHPVTLPENAQQKVLGAYELVTQPGGLSEGELDDLLAPGGKPLGRGGASVPGTHQSGNGGFQSVRVQAGGD